MDRENLENLDEESLFKIQNTISEIIKERNFKKGDIEAIVDDSFNIAFPNFFIIFSIIGSRALKEFTFQLIIFTIKR